MKLGFTGTRESVTESQVALFVNLVTAAFPAELHTGCCDGADEFATVKIASMNMDRILLSQSVCKIVGHPPDNGAFLSLRAISMCDESRQPKPYLARNRNIVDETTNLIAMPKGSEEVRSGTWSTVRYARSLGRKIAIIYPDGTFVAEGFAGTVFA